MAVPSTGLARVAGLGYEEATPPLKKTNQPKNKQSKNGKTKNKETKPTLQPHLPQPNHFSINLKNLFKRTTRKSYQIDPCSLGRAGEPSIHTHSPVSATSQPQGLRAAFLEVQCTERCKESHGHWLIHSMFQFSIFALSGCFPNTDNRLNPKLHRKKKCTISNSPTN